MPKVLKSTDAQSIKINILWACVAMHTQNDTINLLKTFVFIWRQKFMLILHGPFFQKFGAGSEREYEAVQRVAL